MKLDKGITKEYLSGDEAFAEGIRLAHPDVISAYPITPQTIVVERLSELVEEKKLASEFIHVESEHSAMSCAIGASAMGVRAFTATSSQGLLYMAECLPYAAGGRFPIVMMNANRSTALPWNIYGDQRDSIGLLDMGWIQIYVEDAQECLDMALQSYYLAEHEQIRVPVMVNLDGFILTHTYEAVHIPTQEQVDQFLPDYNTDNRMDPDRPVNMGFSAGPDTNTEFHLLHHIAMLKVPDIVKKMEEKFENIFHRRYHGMVVPYQTGDADYILITLGSIGGLVRTVVDELREQGERVGMIQLRFLRPFPKDEIASAVSNAKAIGVLEKDISFGNEGTVYTNVNSALIQKKRFLKSKNFIGGLGGRDITKEDIKWCFKQIKTKQGPDINWIGLGVKNDVF